MICIAWCERSVLCGGFRHLGAKPRFDLCGQFCRAGRRVGRNQRAGNDIDSFQEKLMLNFYGDPTLTLYDSAADVR